MRTPIDQSLRRIGEQLQKDGENTVQTPMPWAFLELLCQLDEKEEALADEANDATSEGSRSFNDARRAKREWTS